MNNRLTTAICLCLFICFARGVAAERLAPPLAEQARSRGSDNGAEVLHRVVRRTVEPDHHWASTQYVSIRINDLTAARDYGRIRLGYNHYYNELELAFANVRSPDGSIKPVNQDALQVRTAGQQDFYNDRSELVFSLPDIQPGAILEVQFRTRSKKLSLPTLFDDVFGVHWYQVTVGGNGARMDPVRNARYELITPVGMTLFSEQDGEAAPAFREQTVAGRKHWIWQWREVSAVTVEKAMPAFWSMVPYVRVSNSKDWSLVGDWTWSLMRDKFAPTPQVKTLAADLVGAEATREEKIKAVYGYLQGKIRYVFAHLGRGGYEPHFAEEVIRQGYGDCKDQTVLAIALLRAMGIDAYPALVVTQADGYTLSLVSVPFDHVMVWIPGTDGDAAVWMDTTGDRSLYPGVSNHLAGQPALIMEGPDRARLVKLDASLPANRAAVDLDYALEADGGQPVGIVDVTVHLSGIYEQYVRSWWRQDNERNTRLEQTVNEIFPQANANIFSARIANAESLWQPVTIHARFRFSNVADEEGNVAYATGLHQVFRVFGDLASLQSPDDRINPWWEPYDLALAVNASFSAENHGRPAVVQSGIDVRNDFFTISQKGEEKDGKYRVAIEYRRASLQLSPEDYRRYYDALHKLDDVGLWTVAYTPDAEKQHREAVAAASVKSGTPAKIKLTRLYLDQGKFAKALEAAESAVTLDERNGEAWYLLGAAQGYNGLVDESAESFARAQGLGYLP